MSSDIFEKPYLSSRSRLFNELNVVPSFTADPNTAPGAGIYTKDEWAGTRLLTDPFFSSASDRTYRLSSYLEFRKIASTLALISALDFESFKRFGEIGGSPFHQARVILDTFPHLDATLTDFDVVSLSAVKAVTSFTACTIKPFDAKVDDYALFDNCDVLTMWGVDYALSDSDLRRLFCYVERRQVYLVLASINIDKHITALLYLRSKVRKSRRLRKMMHRHALEGRLHGYLRSGHYLRSLLLDFPRLDLRELVMDDTYSVYLIYPSPSPIIQDQQK
jgi:hypothetical protein